MLFRRISLVALLPFAMAACAPQASGVVRSTPLPEAHAPVVTLEPGLNAQQAARNFVTVARDMEPRIEAECRARTAGRRNCDYQVVIDERPDSAPNAFQTIDRSGRPVVGFNLALIAEARNTDELAFVMGHEAAHYILGHLERKTTDATAGALILGALAVAGGADSSVVSQAQDIGATVGARAYSKDYELQADRLGAIIAWNAGYNPERGAQFFTRIPDPGHSFMGTHPANSERIEIVRKTVAQLRAGGA